MEVFKRIKEFPNYAITKTGKVKNIKLNKLLSPLNRRGTDCIYLYRNGKQHTRSVPKLLIETFRIKKKYYKPHRDRLPVDYAWLDKIKELDKEYLDKLNYFNN